MFETIKRLLNKEKRFLTSSNGGIKLSDGVLDAYGWLDIVYDRGTGILYCEANKPYCFGDKHIKKIFFDELFRYSDDPTSNGYSICFSQDKDDFLKSTDIFEAMGIKKLPKKQM